MTIISAIPISKPSKGSLVVDKAYFYAKDNAVEHKTVRYELVHRTPETPILRRGNSFAMCIRFNNGRTFDVNKDTLRLHFNFGILYALSICIARLQCASAANKTTGPAPSVLKHTQGILTISDNEEFSKEKDQWDVCVRGKDKDTITLQVQIPCDIPVGIWRLQIITAEVDNPARLAVHDSPNDIFIIFNPWNSGKM